MAEKKAEHAKTYGVGPSAERKNIGADINAFSRIDEDGKVYDKGELVYDPTNDPHVIEQDDDDFIKREEEGAKDEKK